MRPRRLFPAPPAGQSPVWLPSAVLGSRGFASESLLVVLLCSTRLFIRLIFAQLHSGKFEKIEIHSTPKHGSWPELAEIELVVLSGQCLDRRIREEPLLRQKAQGCCSVSPLARSSASPPGSQVFLHHRSPESVAYAFLSCFCCRLACSSDDQARNAISGFSTHLPRSRGRENGSAHRSAVATVSPALARVRARMLIPVSCLIAP